MESKTLTDYEQWRLDNIQRNKEMMASLMLQRKASELSASLKRPRPVKSPKKSKRDPSPPVVIRRSLRTPGLCQSPTSSDAPQTPTPHVPARKRHSLLISEAFADGPGSSDRPLIDAILMAASTKPQAKLEGKEKGTFDPLRSMNLRPKNIIKVLSEGIETVRFFPSVDRNVVVAGNKLGQVGFWDVDTKEEDQVYVYTPHSAPVSGILIHSFSTTKMYTSSYDGLLRLMDFEKEIINTIYSSNYLLFSLCQWPQDINCLYLGEGPGEMKLWDERVGDASNSWALHEDKINTIDFHPQNMNLMATSSIDRTACIWDLRKMNKYQPESIKELQHERAVYSAFFSPSGNFLATSIDDRVGILSGKNFDDLSMIKHNNQTGQTGKWLSSFSVIWGWDDSYLYMGNIIKRAIDVISVSDKSVTVLESPGMTSIPCRLDAHPFKEGTLACASTAGKIYLWTRS